MNQSSNLINSQNEMLLSSVSSSSDAGDERNGNSFNLYMAENLYKSINEKKDLLNSLRNEKVHLCKIYEEKSVNLIEKYRLASSIDRTKLQIECLKEEHAVKKSKLDTDKEMIREILIRIGQRNEIIKQYKEKIKRIKDMLTKSEKSAHLKIREQKITNKEISELEKARVKELDRFIFNVTEIKPKSNEDENLAKSTLTALKDARETIYINGRWISANDQFLYTIVKSKLHSNGDYSSFCKNNLENDSRDENVSALRQQQVFGGLPKNPEHSQIQSALTYTTQFVNLIAFYLNLVLPYSLPHNKFCSQTLKENEKQFTNAVAKLNVNIIYLCLFKHVPLTNLLPKHTLENIYYFVDHFIKMETRAREKSSIIYPTEMIALLDEMFVKCETDDFELNFMPNIPFNDNEEWETLPNSDQIPMDTTTQSPINARSGLLSSIQSASLISSVTNFFRHLGGNTS